MRRSCRRLPGQQGKLKKRMVKSVSDRRVRSRPGSRPRRCAQSSLDAAKASRRRKSSLGYTAASGMQAFVTPASPASEGRRNLSKKVEAPALLSETLRARKNGVSCERSGCCFFVSFCPPTQALISAGSFYARMLVVDIILTAGLTRRPFRHKLFCTFQGAEENAQLLSAAARLENAFQSLETPQRSKK